MNHSKDNFERHTVNWDGVKFVIYNNVHDGRRVHEAYWTIDSELSQREYYKTRQYEVFVTWLFELDKFTDYAGMTPPEIVEKMFGLPQDNSDG